MRMLSLLALGLTTLGLASPASAADPLTRTDELVRAFRAVKSAPEGKTLTSAEKQANSAAFTALDAFFDYDRLTGDSIAAHKDKFKPDELARFSTGFRELIRLVAYPKSGSFFEDAKTKLKLGKRRGKAADVEMHARLEKEDFETTVTFSWEESGGALRLVDVSFEGGSLVKDYANQFGRIIGKDGVAGLLKKLESRLTKERETSVIAP